jgi:hypothetical protein
MCCCAAPGCEKDKVQATSTAPSASAAPPTCDGRSLDPTKSEFKSAIRQLRQQQYATARVKLKALAVRYPLSATVKVWQGDAVLYDSASDYEAAADAALVHYGQAQQLHEQGCTLREGMHYYLAMGTAYAHLRKQQHKRALSELQLAKQRWPDSAEVHYHLARAECLAEHFEVCLDHLERTYVLARQRTRPLFIRVHRSLDDWFVRADGQSEFEALRKGHSQKYQALQAGARADE